MPFYSHRLIHTHNTAIVKCEVQALLLTRGEWSRNLDIHTNSYSFLFEIFFHQHFLCSRGQKRRSCQHFSQQNNSFPDIALPQEITDTSGGWEALASCIPIFSLSPPSLPSPLPPTSHSPSTYWLFPHAFLFPFCLSPTSTLQGTGSAAGTSPS